MLRKSMIILATAAALTAGLTADAYARGGGGGGHFGGGGGHMGGGHMGGGFGGGRIGGGFAGAPMSSGLNGLHMDAGVGRGIAHQHVAGAGDRFHHRRGYGVGAWNGDYDLYDDACGYGYPYYSAYIYGCYPPEY